MSMGGPGEPESLIRADSLAFLSHGSPGGGTLPFIGVSFARFPTSSFSLGRFRFSVFSRLPEESPLAEEGGQGGPGRSGWRRYRPWLRPARQTELLNFMGGGCGLQKDKTGGA